MKRRLFIDDNLFPDGGDPAAGGGAGGGSPNPNPNGGDPNPTALTMEGAAELITQSQAPLLERIEELSGSVAKLAQNATNPQPPNQGGPDPDDPDFMTQLTTDPQKAIQGLLRQEMGTIAPVLGNLMNSGASAFVGMEAQQIDQEFGAGAWDKLFAKPMDTILEAYRTNNAVALADRNTITREVNMLKGQVVNELIKHRDEFQKLSTEEQEAANKAITDQVVETVAQRTNLTGGIRRTESGAEEVTEEVKGYLEERTRAIGGNEDAKEFLQRTNYGNTWEDYQEHQKKMKAAEGGTQ